MDVGLIVLGLIILFGASILFKAAGFSEKAIGETTAPAERKPKVPEKETEAKVKAPETPPKAEASPKEDRVRVCKSCSTTNPWESEFCRRCGKNLLLELPPDIKKQRLWFSNMGWSKNPFTLDVIPALFTGYDDEVRSIMKMISLQSGHTLVTGDIGVGKTTLLKWLELNLPHEFNPLYVFSPPKQFQDIVESVALAMGIKDKCTLSNIDKVLMGRNKKCVLLLDEVHEFDKSTTDSFKTLGDAEGISLVLVGLRDIEGRIKEESPALLNRVVFRLSLHNLNLTDSENMVVKRIENVGGSGHEPFKDDAIKKIYELSQGNPREVIKLCNKAVAVAIDEGLSTINWKQWARAVQDDATKGL